MDSDDYIGYFRSLLRDTNTNPYIPQYNTRINEAHARQEIAELRRMAEARRGSGTRTAQPRRSQSIFQQFSNLFGNAGLPQVRSGILDDFFGDMEVDTSAPAETDSGTNARMEIPEYELTSTLNTFMGGSSGEPYVMTSLMSGTFAPDGSFTPRFVSGHIPASSSINSIISQMLNGFASNFRMSNPGDVMLPLTDDALKQLTIKKYSDITDTDKCKSCVICQDEFKDGAECDDVKILPCKHYFHVNCIDEWLKNYHHKCPVCRQPCGEHTAKL